MHLALVLLRELKLGPASAWHVWIQSLPQHFNTLVHWTPGELDQLQMNSTSAERDYIHGVRYLS